MFMISALDGGAITESSALLVMPFGSGRIHIACAAQAHAPTAEVGEVQDGTWRTLDAARVETGREGVTLTITDSHALNLILVCPKHRLSDAVRSLEDLISFRTGQSRMGAAP